MNLDDFGDRHGIVNDLVNYADSLTKELSKGGDANDWGQIYRFREKLLAIKDFIVVAHNLTYVLAQMDDMKQSDEDSKWTFTLEKELNTFVKKCLMNRIDSLIDCSRLWSFEDYRARNFQNELRQKMTMLRDWYKEEYDL